MPNQHLSGQVCLYAADTHAQDTVRVMAIAGIPLCWILTKQGAEHLTGPRRKYTETDES